MEFQLAVGPSHLDVALPPPGQVAVHRPSAAVPLHSLGQLPLFVRGAEGVPEQDTGLQVPREVVLY